MIVLQVRWNDSEWRRVSGILMKQNKNMLRVVIRVLNTHCIYFWIQFLIINNLALIIILFLHHFFLCSKLKILCKSQDLLQLISCSLEKNGSNNSEWSTFFNSSNNPHLKYIYKMCMFIYLFFTTFWNCKGIDSPGVWSWRCLFPRLVEPGCSSRCGALIPVISKTKADLWGDGEFSGGPCSCCSCVWDSDSGTALHLSLSRLVKEKQMLP